MNKLTMRTLPALLLVAFSGVASAAAFQLWEQNASGLGTAYAGSAAVADNASTIFFNPAGMSELSGFQLSTGVVGVGARYEFHNNGSTLSGNDGGNAGGWHAVPNLYLSARLTDRLSLGFGVSVPFGLATEYDSGWVGRAQTIKSEIRTINYNPSLAYRVNDKVSLGFGVNYQTLDAELTNSVSRLKGDDSAWGWNAGALFTLSPAMRVGISYRSSMKYTLEGTSEDILNGSVPAKAKVELPDTAILSVWQQVSDRWEAMGDISYTRWSTLRSLSVVNRASGVTLGSETFNYDNSWRLAWGAAYKASEAAKIKFGIAYDRTPVSDADRSARVPDSNRLWLSLGGQWNAGRYGKVDLGYSYLYVKNGNINMDKNMTVLRGTYDANAHVVGLQYSVGF